MRGLVDKSRKYHPISGTVLDHLFNFNGLIDFMTELASQGKTYRMLGFLRHEVYTADPINIEHIMVTNFANYGKDLFMKSSLDTVFKVILGVELDTMCGTFEEGEMFSNAFDEASAAVMYRFFNFLWRVKRFLNIGSESVLRNSLRVIDEFVYKLIRIKIEQAQRLQDGTNGDILSRFIELKKTDPKYLRDIVLSFVIAGKDTSAVVLSWFLYMVCKNPHVQEKIAQEISEITKVESS
ncbi:hypothetical protein PIB30_087220 [Stylosanthes scabra]|uniref:Cytochrome P450 n=1 Tax=Stylosanthes scabra TaxID=79078 RepID=A0ABU6RT92_9FABA|nr:hypothetical protein [Stylosanthes scabra]